ncbi:tetratricopeptide repeat protein [Hugenholtzia roseola]|uniref:tetratricopeptide repeat protein n=1 Tax=Hugenholtzia roseola TaxID=1002 RepID=UPI00047DF912|nr:tetratricopeptide repeat protein [Hugenholtzia roseola]
MKQPQIRLFYLACWGFLMAFPFSFLQAQGEKGAGLNEYYAAEQFRKQLAFPQAMAAYDKAIAKEPNNVDYYQSRCACIYEGKKYKESVECFDELLKKFPDHIAAYEMKFAIYSKIGNIESAVKALEDAYSKTNDEQLDERFTYQFRIIDLLFRKGKISEAGKHIKTAHELLPGMPQVMYFDARYENTMGNYKKAVAILEEMIQGNGEEVGEGFDKDYFELGYAYHMLGEYQKSNEAFAKITKGSPYEKRIQEFTPENYVQVADAYFKIYDFALMQELLGKALGMREGFPPAVDLNSKLDLIKGNDSTIAKLNFRLEMDKKAKDGKLEGSATEQRKFMLPPAEQLKIYKSLSKLYMEIGNYDDALEYTNRYLAMNPRDALVNFYNGICLHKTGQTAEAESLFQGIGNMPSLDRGARAMAFFALGVFQNETAQYQLAAKNLQKAAILNPAFRPAVNYEKVRQQRKNPDAGIDTDSEDMPE